MSRAVVPTAVLALLAGLALQPAVAWAQQRPSEARRCRLELRRVLREGLRVETAPGVVNHFLGGDVWIKCRGQDVNMYADSVAIFGDHVAQFIGRVRYRDSVTAIDADFGQYNKVSLDEYFDAQGNVVHRDVPSGSTITGPRVIYYRPLPGVRPEGEVTADQRPTVKYVLTDSAGKPTEPYVILGDRVRLTGGDALHAWGNATVDRSDLTARADTIWIDSGERSAGQLYGRASLRRPGADSFDLTGRSIDLRLRNRELTGLRARDSARLVGREVTLEADSIEIALAAREVEWTRAWGTAVRPHALSTDYEVRGDSLVFESPGKRLRSLRAYGRGWVGLAADSAGGERDWIAGDQVDVRFAEPDSGEADRNAVEEILALVNARTYYRMRPERPGDRASVNYTRADRIRITMKVTGDSSAVDAVQADGNVDGVHLQPGVVVRADTARIRPPEGARP